MKNIDNLLKNHSGTKLLLIFPHPDDEAYVSGGLLQIAEKYSIKTKLICLTKGGRGLLPKDPIMANNLKGIREKELNAACKILGVDETIIWDYKDANLINTKNSWSDKLKKEIILSNPSIIITFDPSGITGHPDHLVVSSEVFNIIKSIKNKPKLLLRVPDKQELSYFKNNKYLKFALKPNYELSYSFNISLKKILAVFAHKSQLKSFRFRLQILEWFLFDNKEYYHLWDNNKEFPFNICSGKNPNKL